ncbi:NADH-quinone oxidoreductase subunit NuoG [Alcaligenes ammonioxydans]|jgi:NADH-quinone oxidoreductase subunit G|uniref:NADH-quinone oxidoreductase subunit NuoG n=1 Tax=Alcaligenes TaxID=507 RepID=UPI000269ECC9|nr:NADH-quinone oxidoreductase subunit NuoG [Alcaligenes ammonioxydans]EJC64948.1 NADH dehydrogenase subunit G [Alcaligenes faecalis subsp. faecalis NCIB 8687]QBH18581.1 NADH-quinone oxidoreductase subunit G [Alcaligenes faecalis]MCH1880922.1 NADH-quinone oxidoreductase subunit NuoG [Alcaligenes ammonioxydans]WGQ34679.1 NADH-quinone oxidoreductase subunit NuoG [Alcaligenes faecalis]HRK85455.1 NADH-quinone oxidoreductase subunit NuoG [Alcaligenes faecalis]
MVELTIDGIKVDAPEGSMVIQAAHDAGVYVPHFCYHKKLSIAANCRMCLVDVEKAPKPLPACATPVTNGMVVRTRSEKAIAAQKSVMEFLLINHPLDCPVCDQGGECQLQDLAVGYGGSESRYKEEKRVVAAKSMGPLISTDAMQRCIHCTRCVRTGEEIAGVQEVGMLNRGEHAEITTFVGRAVESELSGNMIDVCPVGALLSKPFRFNARTWELARRRSVSPHDSVGANLVLQAKMDKVLRVVPFENEEVNECWISDRDRFSYEGLYTEDRLTRPMVRGDDGQWREASWNDAMQTIVAGMNAVREKFGADQLGCIGSATSTTEELALLARLGRALGTENVDFRLRQTDARLDGALAGVPWLGMPLTALNELDRVLVVGSFLRKDHPLMAQRLRQAVKRGAQVSFIDSAADNPLFNAIAGRMTVAPSQLANSLAQVLVAVAKAKETAVPAGLESVQVSAEAQQIADSLVSGERVAVLLGNMAVNSDQASVIAANAHAIAQASGAKLGFLTAGGNTVGGYLANAVPGKGGLTAEQMLAQTLRAYLVLNVEPALDSDLGERAVETLKSATFSVALTSYRSAAEQWADVMLPVSPFTETSGTFVNAEGRVQSFKGAAAPVGDTRPAWKVLRVLGNLFQLDGFDDETSESVRDSVMAAGVESRLSNQINLAASVLPEGSGLERVADVPIYRSDALVRRSAPLQQTPASAPPTARMAAATLAQLGLVDGDLVKVRSSQGEVSLPAQLDDTVALNSVRVATAFSETAALGSAFGQLTVERA